MTALCVGAGGVTAGAAQGDKGPPGERGRNVAEASPTARFVPGEILIRYRDGVSEQDQANVLTEHRGRIVRRLRLPGVVLARLGSPQAVEAVAAALSRRPEVVYAEPNWIYRPAATPNDPRFGELWGLNNPNDADIDAPEAWNTTTGSSNVVVAVVDTGVAHDHPDLAQNMWTNTDEIDGNGVDDDGNGFVDDRRGWDFIDGDKNPRDTAGHGTHVAGTIGAEGNNAVGVAGVNWDVTLMPVRVLGPQGGTNEQVASGFAYAGANGAKVVNASLGGGGFSQTMKNAIDGAPNTLFVVAAGNDGSNNESIPAYPCNYTSANLVCVAATTNTDGLADFSNYGATSVDLAAPGVGILSTWPAYDSISAEGFETDIAGRWLPGGTPNTWARTSAAKAAGSWSATDSPGGSYPANANNWLQKVSAVSFAGREGCSVEYALRLAVEYGFDYFVVDSSTNGTTWIERGAWTGSTGGAFFLLDTDLSAVDGSPSVYLRFGVESDDIVHDDGAYVDSVDVRCVSTSYDANDYNSISGTSMATPHVAGAAALLWAANPSASRAQVQAALLDGVDPKPSLAGRVVTGGRLNAAASVALIVPPTPLCLGSPVTLTGTAAGETLLGTPGDDVIAANEGDDTIIPGGGNDKICGGDGADTVDLSSATGGITANLTSGTVSGQGSDSLSEVENLTGSPHNDSVTGSSAANALAGGGGNDVLAGLDGNDALTGGEGNDTLRPGVQSDDDTADGGNGFDTADYAAASAVNANLTTGVVLGVGTDALTAVESLTGSAGNDFLTGDALGNFIAGGGGDDTIAGGDGNDTLRGGAGDDNLNGGTGVDYVDFRLSAAGVTADLGSGSATGEGTDILTAFENALGSNAGDTLTGTGGANVLIGYVGNDTLNGAAGNDNLRPGAGDDTLDGGAGIDMVEFTSAAGGVSASLATGAASGEGSDTLALLERATGSAGNDTLIGNDANNLFLGLGGDDTLTGAGGTDIVRGGPGNDTLDGGDGPADTADFAGSAGGVTANLLAGTATGDGSDTLAGFEDLIGSSQADTLTGSHDANFISANAGDDTVTGGGGNDTIRGGAGNDTVDGGTGNDYLDYRLAPGAVVAHLGNGTATGDGTDALISIENLLGSGFGDTLTGSDVGNRIDAGAGNDTLAGLAGNDILIGGLGDDTFDGGDGTDTCTQGAGTGTLANCEG